MFIDGKARNMSNVSKLCTEEVYNLHVSAFKYSLPDLHKSALSHAKLAATQVNFHSAYSEISTINFRLDKIQHRQLPNFCIHNHHQSF